MVVGRVVQFVAAPTPDYYIGHGKVEEVRQRVAELGATLVIFDEELSPTQGKHLEDALKLRVMDRAELILDIFALRARSAEAKAQVELAQLEYLLPRLTRMWVHLSRIRGGIGLRGPGETQLETDRRMIRTKIGKLKKENNAPIYAPDREKAVLEKVRSLNKGPLPDRCLEAVYRELMSGSFALEKPLRIAFLGPEGTFSHAAAVQKFGSSV